MSDWNIDQAEELYGVKEQLHLMRIVLQYRFNFYYRFDSHKVYLIVTDHL